MWDFLLRVLLHPKDYIGALNKHTLTLIKKERGDWDTCIFTFSKPQGLTWEPGQHGIFVHKNGVAERKKWRAFSIASTPEEDVITVATTIGYNCSPFKEKMTNMNPGDQITMYGPLGEFYLEGHSKTIVGVAGGVGITPFKAILQDIVENNLDIKLFLIYGGKESFYTFADECYRYSEHENIQIDFLNTPEEINNALHNYVTIYRNEADYFLSGSPRMIVSLRKSLRNEGIKRIFNDPFKGY